MRWITRAAGGGYHACIPSHRNGEVTPNRHFCRADQAVDMAVRDLGLDLRRAGDV